jgi:hypothetical protein
MSDETKEHMGCCIVVIVAIICGAIYEIAKLYVKGGQ